MQLHHRDVALDQPRDGGEILAVLAGDQREGATIHAGATGAADAVHIVFRMGRHVEIEHMRQTLDVEATRGHVGSDQDADFALLEFLQRGGARRLVHVAMQGGGIEAMADQRFRQDIHVAFAITEDDGVLHILVADQRAQGLALHAMRNLDLELRDRFRRGGLAGNLDFLRVAEELVGQLAHFGRHGGREEQGLAQRRQHFADPLDIGHEAHVQHAVGFVDHEDLHAGQHHLAAFEMVDQAARCGDQHVDATIQQLFLFGVVHAADQQRHRKRGILAVFVEALGHLVGQLAGRFQDQGARHACAGTATGQDVDQGQGEAGGFAGASLRRAEHVAAHQHDRDRLCLDRGGGRVTGFGDSLENRLAQA